jgi:2,3-diketo-5-methylthio-1-phosphopentane phosphatase
MHAYCDFDGTITTIDVTDAVLERFAPPEWRDIELAWEAGRINAWLCMSAQIALMRVDPEEIDDFLDTVEIYPSFVDFVNWCGENFIPVSIVSDGVDRFIRRVLVNHGLGHLDIASNRLCVEKDDRGFRYRLEAPFMQPACHSGSGVCKCAFVAAHPSHIYVGDGRSDFCVSANANLLFAKGKLAAHCSQRSIPFFPYKNFTDVRDIAATKLLTTPCLRETGSPRAETA